MPPDDNVIRPTSPNWISPTSREDQRTSFADGGAGGVIPPIGERLAKLEEAVAALRHGHDIMLGVLALGFTLIIAIMIGFETYTLSRIDSLPADFARTNQLLSSAITAAKQPPQQFILVPATASVLTQVQQKPETPKKP